MAKPQNTPATLAKGAMRISKRIVVSYIIDWILIIVIAAIGAVFNQLKNTNKRPFSLQDPSITYPLKPDTVSIGTVVVVALAVPAVITFLICIIFVPGPTTPRSTPKALIWRRKLWEWNTAWLGLALSLATALVATEGLKDLAGKPRPHMLAVCRPDLSADAIARYRLGGLGTSFSLTGATPILVGAGICQETDPLTLRDAFASWPSGHSSFSWAGLGYLTLFLCAKFGVGWPYLTSSSSARERRINTFAVEDETSYTKDQGSPAPPRNTAAAPPIFQLILCVFVPVGVALFICVSRWFDFHHNGIDIFSGAVIGIITSYFSFRYYHMPVLTGSGWSWGARSRGRAFGVGVGRDGYVGDEGWESASAAEKNHDIEAGNAAQITSAGKVDRQDGTPSSGRFDETEQGIHMDRVRDVESGGSREYIIQSQR